jgi:MFS family permease
MVAQSWLVYRLTGSSVLLGAVGFASQFPVLIISPLAGHVADRYSRQRLVIATQAASMLLAFILAALTLTHAIQVWHLFVLAALLGVVNGFDVPARQSFIVHMVGHEDLMNAIALNASMYNGARIIGPAVAGLLVAKIGEGWCFFANGVSYIAVIIGLLMMRVTDVKRTTHDSPLRNILEGFRFVAATRPIRALLLLLALASIASMPYVVLMPIFASQILHGDVRAMGMLFGASGVGALTGLLLLASRSQLKGLSRWVMICATGLGVSLMMFSLSKSFWLSVVLLMPVGGFMLVHMAGTNTLIQSMVPDRLRGRVMSVYAMMFQGMAPFGALLAGLMGHGLGAPATVFISGVVCLLGSLAFAAVLPGMRPQVRELVRAQGLGSQPAANEVATQGAN